MIPAFSLAQISGRLANGFRPEPLPLTPLEFAETLTFRQGKKTEPYNPKRHPPQWFFLDAFGKALRGEIPQRRFITMKPTQDGGTMVTQSIPQLYMTTQIGDPAIAGFPDMVLAGKQWRSKTRPLIVDSRRTDYLPTTGPGSEGNSSPLEVALNGTPLYFMGAGASNEAAQAMISARLLSRDEFDSIDPHNATLMEGRLDSFEHNSITIDNSTLKHDEATPFTKSLHEGLDYHIEYGCVHCGRFVHWQWEHVVMDKTSVSTARDTVHLKCPHCNNQITDLHRIQMDMYRVDNARLVARTQTVDEHGNVVGPLPESLTWSLTWTALDSYRISLSFLAVKFYEAHAALQLGVHEPMRRFYRDRLCRFYTGDRNLSQISITNDGLAAKSQQSGVHKRTVPSWTEYLIVGQDVQGDRHYWLTLACGPRGREAIIDYGYEMCVPLDPVTGQPVRPVTDDDHLAVLERIDARCAEGWQFAGSETRMVPVFGGFDINYRTDLLLPWVATHDTWMGCIGVGGQKAKGMQKTSMREGKSVLPPEVAEQLRGIMDIRQVQGSVAQICFITRSQVQQHAHAALLLRGEDPGVLLLPQDIKSTDVLALHLSSRVWTRDEKNGVWYWREARTRDDLLACLVIARALSRFWRAYQPWLVANAAATPAKPTKSASIPTTPDGRPLLLSDR